ncbi:PREDICTED: proline-rich receptor-like protein kinase PERK2 [Rhagoletis zephyria]|uniref:proline-rich receptor-like protein kinase PERK2 n=1 Tax=Rhagoletis zephyria TaxID=28612 RepID=UPI00081151B1|nr:PREDICTED: proline-rich receptor-like protein kinase PERK2 [Rhagoletis zephyria]
MESLCFLRNSVIPRPCRTSKNILEALQLPPASPHQASNSSQLFTSPLHTPLASSSQPSSELFISLPSTSPPLQIFSTLPSPSPQLSLASPLISPLPTSPQQPLPLASQLTSPLPTSLQQTSSNSQAPSSSRTAQTSRKRTRNITAASEVDLDAVFLESAEHFKKACKAIEEKESSGNEAVHSFTKMIEATIAKMSSVKQSLAMERVTAVVMALQREEEAEMSHLCTVVFLQQSQCFS